MCSWCLNILWTCRFYTCLPGHAKPLLQWGTILVFGFINRMSADIHVHSHVVLVHIIHLLTKANTLSCFPLLLTAASAKITGLPTESHYIWFIGPVSTGKSCRRLSRIWYKMTPNTLKNIFGLEQTMLKYCDHIICAIQIGQLSICNFVYQTRS